MSIININGQVINAHVALNSQSEVNSFVGTSIEGNLLISGSDITDLTALINLTSISGDLSLIENSMLQSLHGLNNIKSNINTLFITNNLLLQNIDGLSNISSINEIRIDNNGALLNLDGLGNLDSSVDVIQIISNPSLTNIYGLNNVTRVGNLDIQFNTMINNLDGLSNIDSVYGDLLIIHNDSLSSFCGLYDLFSSNGLGGSYFILDNLVNPTAEEIINYGTCRSDPLHINEKDKIITDISLEQNYPNPFNPNTIIEYSIEKAAIIKLIIYNSLGEKVRIVIDDFHHAGSYKIKFDGSNLSSGVYFYSLIVDKNIISKQFILLK